MPKQIDQRSYRLGGIGSFSEIVNAGVKKLALSAAMLPQEMDALEDDANRIAMEHDVKLYRERELLVTDLFPATVAKGKHVLLIYQGETLEEYMALKVRKAELVASGQYTASAREKIARKFGIMLSYPSTKINDLIEQNAGQ